MICWPQTFYVKCQERQRSEPTKSDNATHLKAKRHRAVLRWRFAFADQKRESAFRLTAPAPPALRQHAESAQQRCSP
eukprot:12569-Eustigmatos_ZCMA.PRE.1